MEDLLAQFKRPNVMDVKMGIRTYLEDELDKCEQTSTPRNDLFIKMISIDPLQPTQSERDDKAVLKSRYMIWRENLSSTANLGFRIEAIKKSDDEARKEYQRLKSREEIISHIDYFTGSSISIADKFRKRLRKIRSTLLSSKYFKTHEFIGSSLLFVYDREGNSGVWMIDFAKTCPLGEDIKTLTHTKKWIHGNHEDGYLIGLDNLISIFDELVQKTLVGNENGPRRRSSVGGNANDRQSYSSIVRIRQGSKKPFNSEATERTVDL
ncbi:hypothetical protein ACOME3_001459 [Neoechinorhynchus agilis]